MKFPADHKDKKKIFFTTTAGLGIAGCVLNDMTTEERMDEVSSYGYAWGYLGSCIPFLAALIAYVLGPDMVGVLPDFVSKMIGFGVTALWWLVVTLPLLKNYRQKNYVEMRTVSGVHTDKSRLISNRKSDGIFALYFELWRTYHENLNILCLHYG